MKEKQNKNSWFVALPGLFLLLTSAILSIYFRAWMIAAFLCFLFFLCFGSRMWSREVLKQVDFSVDAVQEGCYAGDTLKLKLKLRNRSFLPLVWLDVILPTGKKPILRADGREEFDWFRLMGSEQAQTGIRVRFVWLLWQQEITWEEVLRTFRRGVVEVSGAVLQAGDGFGLSAREEWKYFGAPTRLLIYPKLVPVAVQPFLRITQEAVAQNQGQTEDITILKRSRPYQPGDSVKRVNWRLLAGSGRMEVNVYETVMPGCAAFILDLGSFRREVEEKNYEGGMEKRIRFFEWDLEKMISLTASCMKVVSEQGILTALIIPAYRECEAVVCLPEDDGEETLKRSMEALAMMDYQAEPVQFPYEEFWQVSHKLGNLYFCVRTEEESTLHGLAQHLGRSRARYLALKTGMAEKGEFDCLYAENIALEPLPANLPEKIETGRSGEGRTS